MRSQHSLATRMNVWVNGQHVTSKERHEEAVKEAVALAESNGRTVSPAYATRDVAYRRVCNHEFQPISERWQQCEICRWCLPRVDSVWELPEVLAGTVNLPPLVMLDGYLKIAGFLVSSMVRIRVVLDSSTGQGRRCSVMVKLGDLGWKDAAVFDERDLHKVITVVENAEPKRPRKLWRRFQRAFLLNWGAPWESPS